MLVVACEKPSIILKNIGFKCVFEGALEGAPPCPA